MAPKGSVPWLFGPFMSEQMCVPRECHADGFGCSLLCKQNTCVWIRLLRKVNIPSVFAEITYLWNCCLCWNNGALCARCGVWLVCFFPCLLWLYTWTARADPGESFSITTRVLQGGVTSGSLYWQMVCLTSFLWVNGLIVRMKGFFYSAVHECTDSKVSTVLRGYTNL